MANDRFANDPQFIANAYDLSGQAIPNGGTWATLVSRNVFVTSNHYHPSDGTIVQFFLSNDPNGAVEASTVLKSQRVGTSDLRVGVLATPVGPTTKTYSFASTPISNKTDFISSPYAGANAFMFGRSPANFLSPKDVAVGRNVLDDWFDGVTDTFGTTDDLLAAVENESSDPNFVSYEAFNELYDSGGPLFVDDGNGDLLLIGTNWLTGTSTGVYGNGPLPVERSLSGFTYVGNYATEIQTFIDANPIPEPASVAFTMGWVIALSVFLRRGYRFS